VELPSLQNDGAAILKKRRKKRSKIDWNRIFQFRIQINLRKAFTCMPINLR
jgi:hypothetical protein